MKDLGRMLIGKDAFDDLVIGNTALVRAMVEGGARVVTSYPGSPTPEIAAAISSIPKDERPFYFEFSTNEKVALEVAFGAALNGHSSVVFFKSVGLNVAADSFVQLSMMEIPGGMVVILGDDPGANSSQNEQDNRHYARLAALPLFEPASAQEAYAMMLEALSLARRERNVVIVRMTTHVCHAKECVSFGAWGAPPLDRTPRFDPDASNYIPLAASVFPLKRRALARLERLRLEFETSPFNRVLEGGTKRGIIVAGTARLSLADCLEGLSGTERPGVLELGTIYPLPRSIVRHFLEAHDEVKILEELDQVLEGDIKSIAYDSGQKTRIIGKVDPEEFMGEYLPEKVRGILDATWPGLVAPPKPASPCVGRVEVPARPAQLCPGCGHRSAFFAIKRALAATDITVADIGCHTLGNLEPYRMGRVVLSMGHSTSTASGLSIFNDARNVLCFLGDSTFFHAGMPGIVNALYNSHNVTLVLMENGTTAMTGHQDHPGVGRNFNGESRKIGVREALEGLGVTSIREVDAYRQADLTRLVTEAIAEPGLKVIIAKHPCMLKLTREARRRPGWKARRVMIDQGTCTQAHICVEGFACPSFQISEDGTVAVHEDLCIGDGSCKQACPASAIGDAPKGGD
ncbi:MAG: thiamine pyrophosphate-dependent enzyme [Spirochaetota bacterium]